ncbi:putative ribonuclease H-like domain-containing protein [Tanacetum coccineum]
MELENSQNNALAKLPMLKLGEYEMWEIRIKQYFQIQDYALWEVIENGNSWVPIPVTATETGPSTGLKMTVPSTAEEKICKKNDVKARTRFGGNEATKKTQKALLKQQYENFSASNSESLNSTFNRLQRLVSRLAILGVVTPPEDLNKVKKYAGASNDDKNLAFVTTSGASSTNNINTVNPEVSTATTKVNTASTEICTASFSDATVYAFLSTQPKGSQLVHEDLEQLHDDDLEEMDLKWNMALLSMRARKFYQRTGRKIIIDGSNTAGYDKSKCAGVDWSDMAEEEYDDLLVKLSDTDFKAATYKRGLATLEGQIVKYKEHEVLFSEEIALLKRSVGCKEYELGLLRTELEKITDKSKKGVGYNAVPSPHPLILNRPTTLDLSYSGLEEFKEPEVNEYGPRDSSLKPTTEKPVRKNNDAPIIEDWVSDDEDEVESPVVVKKKTVIPTAAKIEKPVRKQVRYAEMYRSQRPRGNQRNWNGQKSNQLGCNFVFNNKACFICGSFDHIQYSCPNQQRKRIVSGNNYNKEDNDYYSKTSHPSAHKHMAPRAVLMKTGLKSFNSARPVNTVRSVNTGRPFSTARKNRTLIEAARTMLADSKLPTTFWAKAVSTACYVQNRVLIVKPHNKTPYELFRGFKPTTGFMKPFGYHVTILNTLDNLASIMASRSVADAQIQDKDRLHDENDASEKSPDDSSLKDNGTAVHKIILPDQKLILVVEKLVTLQSLKLNCLPERLVTTTPHTRTHKDHPIQHVIGDVQSYVQTRRMTTYYSEQGFLSANIEVNESSGTSYSLFACFQSFRKNQKKVLKALVIHMGNRAIGTKWVYRNKKDERGIVIRNKARLVAQGHTQEEGIDYDEVFAPVARIEAIRMFLAYASYMGFMVYQMDVKSAFLYGQIEEEVIIGKIDQTLFIKRQKGHILLVQIYVDDIIFGSTKKELCDEFEKLMKDKFQMSSMGELTFFLGLQIQQKKKDIFISQINMFNEILRKFNYTDVKSASTPTDLEKILVQDGDAADVDEHLYRSMIGSLMYLTTSRPDIMFAVCACARFQVSPKTSHLLAVKRIFRYLKGKPSLGLWYSKDSSLLISWQCKKQTVVATSTTEAEYVAAACCCVQKLLLTLIVEVPITAINDGQSKTNTASLLKKNIQVGRSYEQGLQHEELTNGNPGVEIRLFPTMLTSPMPESSPTPSSSPSRITSSHSLLSEPSTEPTFEPQPLPDAEYHVPSPNESTLHVVHSHGSDEGSLKLNELTNLVTKLSETIGVLEDDLKKTKQTYKDEEDDSSKQGRIDEDPNTYFTQDDEVVHDQDTATERQLEDSTVGITVSTAPINISTARESHSTAGRVMLWKEEYRKEERKDFNHNFVPMDLEIEKEKKKPAEFQEIEIEQIEKYTTGKRKKSLPRKRTRSTTKRQKVELDDEKEDLKEIIRGMDSSKKNYKILSEMLYDFDRQDIVELYRLIKESWSLCDFCGVYILLMQNGIAIHMLTEKKYPLSKEMISKMLSKRLEVYQESTQAYELLKFIRSQVKKIDQGLGSTSGIRACALRNFDLEVMELENTQNNALAKLPMLKLGEYEMWEIRIKQYFQIQDYALWEVIENGNSWVPIPETTPPESGTSTTIKMIVPATIKEKTCKKNDVKARSNEATKKTQKALLKQQYENFSASSSESLDSIFNRLQKLVSRLAILGVVTPPEDLNLAFSDATCNMPVLVHSTKGSQQFLKTLSNIMIMILELEGKSSLMEINTAGYENQKVECFQLPSTGTLPGNPEHLGVKTKKLESSRSTKTERLKMLLKSAILLDGAALIGVTWQSVGCKEYELGLLRTELEKVKQEKEGVDFKIAKFDKSAKDLNEICLEEFKEPEVNEYGPRDSSLKPTTGCDKESDNSKENTDDSLEQHQMTDTETSSFESPLKVDKDWKEKFFYPANHVESVNKIEKPVRKNNDSPIIEDWVSDDEDEVESPVMVKKKTVIPIAAKIEKPVRKQVRYAEMYRAISAIEDTWEREEVWGDLQVATGFVGREMRLLGK